MNISPASSVHLTPSAVGPSLTKAAAGDGDGLTGAAALNDGDAAAQAAARSVRHTTSAPAPTPAPVRPGSVDVHV
jgi:hypothetical protein